MIRLSSHSDAELFFVLILLSISPTDGYLTVITYPYKYQQLAQSPEVFSRNLNQF